MVLVWRIKDDSPNLLNFPAIQYATDDLQVTLARPLILASFEAYTCVVTQM